MKFFVTTFVFLCFWYPTVGVAQEPESPSVELLPAEQELVDLMDEYELQLAEHWEQIEKFDKYEDAMIAIADGQLTDPNAEFIPKLLAFEEEHRREDVGLSALWNVFKVALRGGGEADSPTFIARTKAIQRLSSYARYDSTLSTIRIATFGNDEPALGIALRSLINSDEATPLVHKGAQFLLAKRWLSRENNRLSIEKRLSDLLGGAKIQRKGEAEYLKERLKSYPDEVFMAKRVEEAMAILDKLSDDKSSPRLLKIVGVDPKWRIVRAVEDESQPLLSTKVAAFLFKERHLKVGAMAPPVAVTLVGGEPWSLADQRGRVVVIQFSFTGCGPCARMYPGLKEMTEAYPDSLSVLTLLRDKTSEAAIKGISDGKFTWGIALDGKPGRIAAKWSVDGFPSVYVIDREGRIAASDIGENSWRAAVEKLMEVEE